MNQPKAHILLVEDDPAILRGLTDVFVFHGFSIKGVADGAEGLSEALSGRYDLAVLDVMLPSLDGFSICRELRAKKPGQAIIMLTAKGAEKDIVTGFSAGADDYVPKPFSIAELMVRVEAVLRRAGKNLGDESFSVCGITVDGATLTARQGDKELSLTRREVDILCHLARAGERIVGKKELLSEVWQYRDPDVETRTVDIHIQKLRKKLAELSGGLPIIQTVRGEGFRISCE